jgi:hypothetical protein
VCGVRESLATITSCGRACYDGGAMTRRELHREIEELRTLLALSKHRTIGEWEAMPQERRDQLAAKAWISEWGDPTAAMLRLGFPALNKLPQSKVRLYSDYVTRIFQTPGVRAILKQALTPIDEDRAAMLARQVKIALHGEDTDAVRAFQALSKVCRWASRADSSPSDAG